MSGFVPDTADPQPMPFVEVMAHIRVRRPGALRLFLAIIGAALLIAALFPPRFYATATLAVLPAPEFTVRQDAGSHALSTSALEIDQVMKAETEILQSADLHEGTLRAVGMLKIYPDLDPASANVASRAIGAVAHILLSPWIAAPVNTPATSMARALQRFDSDLLVLPTKDANVIAITFHHRDGILAAQLVNTMLARYAEQRKRLYVDPQIAVVQRETEQLASTVRDADTALSAFKTKHGISDYAAERDLLLRRLSAGRQTLSDTDIAVAEQRARLAALDHAIDTMPRSVGLYNESDNDTRLQGIDASLVDLRAQVTVARVNYRDTSHKVTDLLTQLRAREADRQRMAQDPAPSTLRTGRSPALDSLLLDRAHATTEEEAAAARRLGLRSALNDLAARLAALTAQETSLAEFERRKEAADTAFATASQVLAERRMTEAEDALRLANVRIIQPARAPLHAAPIPQLVALAGALLGALAASLWCLAGVLVRPTLLTQEGLVHATGLPVLGVFPAPQTTGQQEGKVFLS